MKEQLQFLLAFFAFLNIGNAQQLEPSFGNNGIAITSFDFSSIYLYDMEVLPNGKFVSIGYKDQAINAFYLTQQLPNGDLDTSFNHSGIKQFGFGNSYEFAVDIDLDANGNFLIAGTSNGSYALARMLPSGIFDSTFANNGIARVSFGEGFGSNIRKIKQQADGKIIAIGEAYSGSNFDFAAARFNINGTLDSTFGTDGKAIFDFSSNNDFGNDLVIEADGKITIAGRALNSDGTSKFALLRLNSNGTLDNSFGNNGKTISSINAQYEEVFNNILKLSDGSYIASGHFGGDFTVFKYTPNGVSDNSFGTSGHVTTDFGDYQDDALALAIDNQGKILLAGYASDTLIDDFFQAAIVRYNSNGTLDNTFDEDGKFAILLGSYSSQFRSIHLVENGDILLGGTRSENQTGGGFISNFVHVKLNSNSTTNLEDQTNKFGSFLLYPNPAQQFIKVAQQNNIQNCTLKIQDISGKFIYQSTFHSPEIAIDLSDFEIGIYFISIGNQNHISTYKFIKQ